MARLMPWMPQLTAVRVRSVAYVKSTADDFEVYRNDYETEDADDPILPEETSPHAEKGDITKVDMDVFCDVLEDEILKSEIDRSRKKA